MPSPTLVVGRTSFAGEPRAVSTAVTPVSYAADYAAFSEVYKRARACFSNGQNPLVETYQVSNALVDGDIEFGVEIEFNDPDGDYDEDDYYERESALADVFYQRGWTPTPYQESYHARHNSTSRSHQGGWRFEVDGSVSGGEMISPICADTRTSWETLRDVVQTIKDNGGVADDSNVGGHVHVSTDTLGDDITKWNRLFRLFWTFEDVFFRLGANPHRSGRHRGTGYCAPGASVPDGYGSVYDALSANMSHASALCAGAVRSTGIGHVEFRLWDGSLDAAVIQSQIKLSVALVAAASNPEVDAVLDDLDYQPVGSHYRARREADADNRGSVNLRGAAWRADTERFRILVDTLFTRTQDKEQITTLYAMTKWSRHSGR